MTDGYTVIPLSPIRKMIAARMTEAKREIPHFRLVADLEVDALIDLRRQLRDEGGSTPPSMNDLLIKACASALMDVPAINIQWVENEVRQYHTADISVAIAVDAGLFMPIVRRAESKTIWDISREVRQLASKAAKKALRMEEIIGGSFSISNLGMYGVDQFDAIINPPQCAILAVGCSKPSVLVSETREPRIATVMRATLSMDHRAIDGKTAAEFLSALRRRVEQPAYLKVPAEIVP
jgi:pyruvate dehydrogenase E2 component (dihydrolipoamide acetyltransferase)